MAISISTNVIRVQGFKQSIAVTGSSSNIINHVSGVVASANHIVFILDAGGAVLQIGKIINTVSNEIKIQENVLAGATTVIVPYNFQDVMNMGYPNCVYGANGIQISAELDIAGTAGVPAYFGDVNFNVSFNRVNSNTNNFLVQRDCRVAFGFKRDGIPYGFGTILYDDNVSDSTIADMYEGTNSMFGVGCEAWWANAVVLHQRPNKSGYFHWFEFRDGIALAKLDNVQIEGNKDYNNDFNSFTHLADTNVEIDGLDFRGMRAVEWKKTTPPLANFRPSHCQYGLSTFQLGQGDASSIVVDGLKATACDFGFKSPPSANLYLKSPAPTSLLTRDYTEGRSRVSYKAGLATVDAINNPIAGIKMVAKDSAGLTRKNLVSDANGKYENGDLYLLWRYHENNTALFVISPYDIYFHKYGYKYFTLNIGVDKDFSFQYTAKIDVGVTEVVKVTVEAYTALNTIDRLYDYFMSYLEDNLGDVSLIAKALGSFADFVGYKVVIANAGVPLAIAGSTLTINGSLLFSIGSTFTGIQTSNIVEIDTQVSSGLNINGDARLLVGNDLTDVTITGDLYITESGANLILDFNNVSVLGNVINDNPLQTLTINSLSGSALTTNEAGTGVGLVNIVDELITLTIQTDNGAEVRIRQGSHTLFHVQNVVGGEVSYSYTYVPNTKVTVTAGGSGFDRRSEELVLSSADSSLLLGLEPNPSYI